MPISDSTREQLDELVARYPRPRSALMPMLHLLQSIEGEVTPDGIGACADAAGVTSSTRRPVPSPAAGFAAPTEVPETAGVADGGTT